MGDAGILRLLLSPGPPLWLLVLGAFVLVYRNSPAMLASFTKWMEMRAKIRSDLLGGAMQRIDRLEASEQRCRDELASIHAARADDMRRIAELEGYMMGRGKADQDAARIVAIERMKDRN